MIDEALDLKQESDALYNLLRELPDAAFAEPTQFKDWTLNDVLEHLHMWNWAANESHVDEKNFTNFLQEILSLPTMKEYERNWVAGLHGQSLLAAWHEFYTDMCARFHQLDPKKRLKWAGPDMSARSSVSARLMETWAHGQEVYDHLGVVRKNSDSIKAIAVLGCNTYSWTYAVREMQPPAERPYVCLTAPSGAVWEFGEPSTAEYIKGEAADFCQVVTQVRNIADVNLEVVGAAATDWMSRAQCFAGHVSDPPPPNTRFTRK